MYRFSHQASKSIIFSQCFFSHLGFFSLGLRERKGVARGHIEKNKLQPKSLMVKSNSSSSLTLLFSFNSSFTALTYLSRSGSNRSVLEIFVQSQSSLVQSLSQETQKVDQGGFQSAFGMSLCSDPPGLGGSSASSGPRPWSRDTVLQTAGFIFLILYVV